MVEESRMGEEEDIKSRKKRSAERIGESSKVDNVKQRESQKSMIMTTRHEERKANKRSTQSSKKMLQTLSVIYKKSGKHSRTLGSRSLGAGNGRVGKKLRNKEGASSTEEEVGWQSSKEKGGQWEKL